MPLFATATVREAGKPFTIKEIVLYGSAETEIAVRVVAAGRCHTDLAVPTGRLRFGNQES